VATSLVLAGVTAYVEAEARKYAPLAAGLGQVGAGMLLARYSRDNEREADALGLKYMTRAGCGAEGFVGLMKMLNDLSESRSGMVDLLFSTHPMSRERYQTAVKAVDTSYAAQRGLPLNRDRFMDSTAALRQMKEAVEAMQRGDEAMMQDKAREAETQYGLALKKAPDDYAALLMMAKCQLAQKKHPAACRYSSLARQAYPQEAQACHVSGLSRLMNGEFSSAYEDFAQYDRMLPGNPNTTFYKGLCLEKMNRRRPAAQEYADYLQQAPDGEHADYARTRLAEWGYGRRRRQG
jgi:predicted Zn-dependent protease